MVDSAHYSFFYCFVISSCLSKEERRLRSVQLKEERRLRSIQLKEERKIREEKERIEKEERENRRKRQQEIEAARSQQLKEAEWARYQQLRREIEAMPRYENWQNAVFLKCGRKCEMCGKTNVPLQVHHLRSFHSLLKLNRISTNVQAFECPALWDPNNGSVLCEECHAN